MKDDLVEGREALRTDDLKRQEMTVVQLEEAGASSPGELPLMPAWRSSSSTTWLR
ncbi:MAG: hypothetical protein ACLPN6_30880 [Streptosporangiaceae bacterium]